MDQTLYFRLLIALCSLSGCIQRQYHYINTNKTWTEAQSYCREKYVDLATITNMEEMKQMRRSVNTTQDIWIGLKKTSVFKWKWSQGDPVNYLNWENGQSNGTNNCSLMRNGKWHHQDCNVSLHFVCYNESTKRYTMVGFNKTWREAQTYCRQYHTDLASVRNQTENEEIEKVINNSYIHEAWRSGVWIGLFKDSWEWSDKNNSSFRNWQPDQPNNLGSSQECTEVYVRSQSTEWNDWYCSASLTFVCYKDKLVLIKENLSWPEAVRYCRKNHVDLLSVDSEKIQHWVAEVVKQASTGEVWLGLHYYCYMDLWIWVRDEIVCYQNWVPGNGTAQENCDIARAGAVQSGGDQRWISLPQTHKLNFICSTYD